MALKNNRELDAWKKAMNFVEAVNELTDSFSDEKKFGLTSQLHRAAVSVPSHNAEGYGRVYRGDYLHHLSMADGSLAEAKTQLILVVHSVRLHFIVDEQAKNAWNLSQDVGELMSRLQSSLRPHPKPNTLSPKSNEN